MPDLEDDSNVFPNDGIFSGSYDDEDVGAEADFNNMDNTIDVSPIPTLRVHKDHHKGQIIGDLKSAVQTRGKIQKASSVQQALVSYFSNQNRTNHKDYQNCLLACFLSQEEPKTISQALKDESWVEAMQEELLQVKLQKVWILVDLPFGKKEIGTKWVFRNKRDERSIVVKNKARLVAQGFRQEEGINYDEFFAPVAGIEAIKLFLAFASFMRFPIYQMDVKSAFLYGTIEEEVKQQPDGIFISQDKSMIGSLMYLTASRQTSWFAAVPMQFQVIPESFTLKMQLKGLFSLLKTVIMEEPYLDWKSTTGGMSPIFFGKRLIIYWQCKKQTIVANSTMEAEYVVAVTVVASTMDTESDDGLWL
ncbi:putative ribonuclease H-like domain-containing protein [Tanacetum coccineum]